MSLATGIATGYGLVQQTKEADAVNKFRQDQLAATTDYRNQTLGIQDQQRQDLASYRDANLKLNNKIADLDSEYRNNKLAGDIENDVRDDEIRLAEAANRKISNQAALVRAQTDADAGRIKALDFEAAQHFAAADNLYTLSQADLPTRQRLKSISDSALKTLDGSTHIDLNALASMDLDAYHGAYMSMLGGLQSGELQSVDNVQMAAITDMIGFANTKSIGKKITPEEFPSAPIEFNGHTIVSITGHDAAFVEGNKIRGELAVRLRSPEGEENYYYPDLTEYRGGNTAQLLIDADDGMKKFGGTSLMYANLKNNPVYMKYIDDGRVEKKGGEKEVDAAVKTRVDAVEKVLEDNREAGLASALFIENHDLQYLVKPGEDINSMLDNMSVIYDRARKNLLYGTSTQDRVDDARGFTAKLQDLMPSVMVNTGDRSLKSSGANGRQTVRGSGIVSLEALIGKENIQKLRPNQMAYINAAISSEDGLTVPAQKYDRLQAYLENQGLMAKTP
jgi:hypothetical protein